MKLNYNQENNYTTEQIIQSTEGSLTEQDSLNIWRIVFWITVVILFVLLYIGIQLWRKSTYSNRSERKSLPSKMNKKTKKESAIFEELYVNREPYLKE